MVYPSHIRGKGIILKKNRNLYFYMKVVHGTKSDFFWNFWNFVSSKPSKLSQNEQNVYQQLTSNII